MIHVFGCVSRRFGRMSVTARPTMQRHVHVSPERSSRICYKVTQFGNTVQVWLGHTHAYTHTYANNNMQYVCVYVFFLRLASLDSFKRVKSRVKSRVTDI
jgi:hypothetical protein